MARIKQYIIVTILISLSSAAAAQQQTQRVVQNLGVWTITRDINLLTDSVSSVVRQTSGDGEVTLFIFCGDYPSWRWVAFDLKEDERRNGIIGRRVSLRYKFGTGPLGREEEWALNTRQFVDGGEQIVAQMLRAPHVTFEFNRSLVYRFDTDSLRAALSWAQCKISPVRSATPPKPSRP